MIYPNSTAEFRLFVKKDGTQFLQLRYVNQSVGYKSAWSDIPVVKEDDKISATETPRNV